MRIRITKVIGSKVDGVPMGPYHLGQEYDVDDERGRLFVGSAMAEEVVPVEAQPVEVVAEAVAADAVTDITTDADSESTSRRRRR